MELRKKKSFNYDQNPFLKVPDFLMIGAFDFEAETEKLFE